MIKNIVRIFSLQNVENVTLNLANKLFIGKDFSVKSQYKQDLQTYYHSDIESVDFSQSAKAADTINTWSKEKTNNRIDSIVQAGKEQFMFRVYLLYNHITSIEKCGFFILYFCTNNLNIYIYI